MIAQMIGAFIAVFTIAVTMSVPKKFLVWGGIISAISWLVYLLCDRDGLSVASATLISTLIIATISHIMARTFKAPVTVFLIPGILPLVPGVHTYRIVYYLIQEESSKAVKYFYLTLQIAGMIAIGIFIIDTIFHLFSGLRKRKLMNKSES